VGEGRGETLEEAARPSGGSRPRPRAGALLGRLAGLGRRRGARAAPAYRTVEVRSPSATDEASSVLLAAAFVVLVVIYVYAFERYGGPAPDPGARIGSALLPYQTLFRDLPSDEQRRFREMQEGALEAVRIRGESGSWPSVGALASDGVPPFARSATDRRPLRWTLRRAGLVADYVGAAGEPGQPSFLIHVQEPDPVTGEKPPPPSVVDEEHQLLPDGTLLHVTYWKRAGRPPGEGIIGDPARLGWTQIRVRTLLEEMERSR